MAKSVGNAGGLVASAFTMRPDRENRVKRG